MGCVPLVLTVLVLDALCHPVSGTLCGCLARLSSPHTSLEEWRLGVDHCVSGSCIGASVSACRPSALPPRVTHSCPVPSFV